MSSVARYGCDVAKWNPITSYSAMKADGITFAIPKAINKSLKKDGLFEKHWDGFTKAGVDILGTYHYTYATNTAKAKESAKAWVGAVDDRTSVYFLDWEDSSLPTKNSNTMKNIIETYADVIKDAGGTLAIYTGMYLYNAYIKKLNLPYDMWIARYYLGQQEFTLRNIPNDNYCPACDDLLGWQYTSKGKVNGCKGNIDLDVWFKNTTFKSTTITATFNPFPEPTENIRLGSSGNGANWVLWCLWRFGMLVDAQGRADKDMIDGLIDESDVEQIKKAQKIFALDDDGIVGPKTKAIFRKYC